MSTITRLMIVYACAVLAAPVIGNYTDCLCNVNHARCVNLKCATDTTCQRVATVTNNGIIESDDMFCSKNGSHDILCNSAHTVGDHILVKYCCGDPYCNANNTYLFEFITSQLGDEVSDLLNSVVTPRPTSMPASKNERTDNNKGYSSSVWIVIALLTIIFITLQIICVTIALIIGCRKLK